MSIRFLTRSREEVAPTSSEDDHKMMISGDGVQEKKKCDGVYIGKETARVTRVECGREGVSERGLRRK